MRTKTRTIAAIAAAASLLLGALGPGIAFAQTATPTTTGAVQAKQGTFGTVSAKGSGSITIKTAQGTQLELAVTGDTQFRTGGDAQVSFSDLAVGSRIAVLTQADGKTAIKVMVVPGQPQREHRVLTVTDVSGRTVTAQDQNGETITVELDHDISADVKGQLITFIGNAGSQSNRFKGNAEVKIQQIVERLEKHGHKAEADAKAAPNATEKDKKSRDLADLKAKLEANMQRHLDLFAEIIVRAPDQAKASLQAALNNFVVHYKASLEGLGEAKAEVGAKLDLRTIHGSIESIDGVKGEITVRSHGDAVITLKTSADTKVQIGGQTGKLTDIGSGDVVSIRYNPETKAVTEIRVQLELEAKGTIKSVDAAAGSIVLALENGATLTLKVTTSTAISLNNQKATLADLKANAEVKVNYNTKTREASRINADSSAMVQGTVKGADVAKGTVTILTEDGKELVLTVSDSTRVILRGVLFGVLGLSAGMHVDARYDTTSQVASDIHAREAQDRGPVTEAKASGTVGAVDASKGELVVSQDEGGTITLKTDGKTEIRVDGKAGLLTSIRAGDRIRVVYDAGTKVATKIETNAKAEAKASTTVTVSASVKSIDLLAKTVTITAQGKDITLRVVGESKILVKGSVVILAALTVKPGDRAEVQYNSEANTLVLMEIR